MHYKLNSQVKLMGNQEDIIAVTVIILKTVLIFCFSSFPQIKLASSMLHKGKSLQRGRYFYLSFRQMSHNFHEDKVGLRITIVFVRLVNHINIKVYIIILLKMQHTPGVNEAISALDELIKKSKPATSTTMKSAVVALFSADSSGELRYSNCIGLMQLDIDRSIKTKMLRFYDMQTICLVFEVQLYYGFSNHYKMVTDTFYTFEYPMGLIGLLFKSKDDADIMNIKISSFSPKVEEFEDIKKKRMQQAKERKKEGSLFNKLKVFLSDEPEQPKQKSGEVLSVQKGIAFDLKTGEFNTEKIPAEWQQIFDSLKLTKKDLQNKQITNLIAEETIMRQVKTEAAKNHDVGLQNKVKEASDEERQYLDACRQSAKNNLPPPPPPPPLLLVPPQLAQNRGSFSSKRANLMDEIRNNKLKLNHVCTVNNDVNLDISNMNKEERMDHAEQLRQKLKQRKQAFDKEFN